MILGVISVSVILDMLDREILKRLQKNARVSFSRIARELGVNEATVRYRVKKLIEEGVITKFTALLNPTKIGVPINAIIMAKIDPRLFEKASSQIADFDETYHVFQSTGEYDIVIVANTRDMEHLSELRRHVEMIPGVNDVLVSATIRLIKIKTSFDL